MSGVTYDRAVQAVDARLGAQAAAHSRRVGDTAAALAIIYGVDPDDARLAGLVHDWDRERDAETLLAEARQAGVPVSDVDAAQPHLLHARTGAEALRHELPGVPEVVLRAVSRHTVGARDMSELDMIVYLADMIEPARRYHGVEGLRDAVGSVTLRELFARGYERSLLHLVKARKPIHPDTVVVWNDIVAGEPR